jgi:predicted nucleotidyltransferase
MDMTRDEILKKLEENRETIRGFGVRRLGIFGSYARAEQTLASDMDFLVEFGDATLQNYLNLKDFLERLFRCRVDLVFADTVKPRLRPIIFNEVVYAEGL